MTHEEFRRLYEAGEIEVRIFAGEKIIKCPEGAVEDETVEHREVEAFEYNGKYFIRFHVESRWTFYNRIGKRVRLCKGGADSHYIKEFDTKTHANNYYKKFIDGFDMKRV